MPGRSDEGPVPGDTGLIGERGDRTDAFLSIPGFAALLAAIEDIGAICGLRTSDENLTLAVSTESAESVGERVGEVCFGDVTLNGVACWRSCGNVAAVTSSPGASFRDADCCEFAVESVRRGSPDDGPVPELIVATFW